MQFRSSVTTASATATILGWVLGALGFAASASVPRSGFAATYTWTADSLATRNWSDSGNWTPGAPANDGSADIVFTGEALSFSSVDSPWNIDSITFSAGAGIYEVSTDQLTIQAGGITNNSSVTQIVAVPIVIGESQVWNVGSAGLYVGYNPNPELAYAPAPVSLGSNELDLSGSGNIYMPGPIGGNANSVLAKLGNGVLYLDGTGYNGNSNTAFAGTFFLVGGTLSVAETYSLGTGLLVADGGAIESGYDVSGQPVTVNNAIVINFPLIVNGANNLTFDGPISGNGGITMNGAGNLGLGGGPYTFTGALTINDGTAVVFAPLAGNVTNDTTFYDEAGNIGGRLTNKGLTILYSSFTAGNGMENDGILSMPAGASLTLQGAGLNNQGSLSMNGGVLAIVGSANTTNGGTLNLSPTTLLTYSSLTAFLNSGALNLNGGLVTSPGSFLTNELGAVVSGPGIIQVTYSNSGELFVPAGTTQISSFIIDPGDIQLSASGSILLGGAIPNSGVILGQGTIGNAVNNQSGGTIKALGGVLVLGGALQNQSGALLAATSNSYLLVASGLATNAGVISLTGGTFDNDGFPLSNTGQISGYGTFATGGTGLDNNGTITFSGGLTTVNGPVTNESGQTITIAYNPAIFTGLVTNVGTGTFKTLSTTATFAGGSSGAFTNDVGADFVASGTGTIEIDSAPTLNNNSLLTVSGGTLRLKYGSAPTIGVGVAASVSSGATLELAGSVSQLSAAVNISNSGTLLDSSGAGQFVGTVGGTGATVVNPGANMTAYQIIQNSLTISGNGKVTLLPSGSGSTTNPAAPNNINFSSNVTSLSIAGTTNAWTGTLDIGNNGLVIAYGSGADPYTAIDNMIASGYDGGTWQGTGITSSLAAAAVTIGSKVPALNIGLLDFTPGKGNYSNTTFMVFEGQTITTDAVLLRLTYMDDLLLVGNMTGFYSSSDALLFAANYGSGTTWSVGDIAHEGLVGRDDALLFAANYSTTYPSLDGTTGNEAALSGAAALGSGPAAVPEPAGIVLVAIGSLCLLLFARSRAAMKNAACRY